MAVPLAHVPERRFTPSEVLRMLEAGILRPDEPVELLEGRLVLVAPQGPPHASTVALLGDRLRSAYGTGLAVREEKPIELLDSLPEPDLAVVRGSHLDYGSRHPHAHEVVLAVEVAVTSQAMDRDKIPIYARAGIPVLWLLDVPAHRLEVHADPRPDGRYRTVRVLGADDEVELPSLGAKWKVLALFARPG
jgi:Uma2 family endonuclease